MGGPSFYYLMHHYLRSLRLPFTPAWRLPHPVSTPCESDSDDEVNLKPSKPVQIFSSNLFCPPGRDALPNIWSRYLFNFQFLNQRCSMTSKRVSLPVNICMNQSLLPSFGPAFEYTADSGVANTTNTTPYRTTLQLAHLLDNCASLKRLGVYRPPVQANVFEHLSPSCQ